jgi:hypothetical protein
MLQNGYIFGIIILYLFGFYYFYANIVLIIELKDETIHRAWW